MRAIATLPNRNNPKAIVLATQVVPVNINTITKENKQQET
jgi:hypothetical protein